MAFDVGDADLGDALLCYSTDGRPSLVQGSVDGRPVTLLGAATPLTNERLDDEGNAALALGLLGARARLVWYLPSPTDVPASAQQSFYDLVPSGVWWGLVQVAVAVLLLALWRARRLGPVVAEPLPVVVRAAETVEGRARLYRRSGARGQAAEALRAGARDRLGTAARAAAPGRTARRRGGGRGPRRPERAGRGGAPVRCRTADDAALVRLADDLDALEREVRRP